MDARGTRIWLAGALASLIAAVPALGALFGAPATLLKLLGFTAGPAVLLCCGVGVCSLLERARLGAAQLERAQSEALALREQIAQVDRLTSLGTITATVAHDISSPLSFATSNVNFALQELQRPSTGGAGVEEVRQALAEAAQGLAHVTQLCRDLRGFSRLEDSVEEPVDLHRVLDFAVTMAEGQVRGAARLVKEYGEVPPVAGSPARLGQVFLNLVINAVQAVEGPAEKNQITLRTFVDSLGHAVVEVRDTGCGIAPELRDRIFDPFFTTKPVGVGTGLGLPAVRKIVTALHGELELDSEVGRGTTFRLRLPPAPVARAQIA